MKYHLHSAWRAKVGERNLYAFALVCTTPASVVSVPLGTLEENDRIVTAADDLVRMLNND